MIDQNKKPELSPQGVNLAAMLAAYDEATAGMTPEERKRRNQQVITGEKPFVAREEVVAEKRAEARVADLLGKTPGKANDNITTLKEAGLEDLVALLGMDETQDSH